MDVKDHKALQTSGANSGAWTYLVLMERSCNLSLSLRMVVNNHEEHDYGWWGWGGVGNGHCRSCFEPFTHVFAQESYKGVIIFPFHT